MKKFTVFGASDDLIEVNCDGHIMEHNIVSNCPYRGTIFVHSDTIGIEVHCVYTGCWSFAIRPDCKYGETMPNWNITRTFGDKVQYSETVVIDLPDDAMIAFELVQL